MPPPQAIAELPSAMNSAIIPSAAQNLRRRGPMPNKKTHASTAPELYQLMLRGTLLAVHAACWLVTVVTVSVAVPAPVPEMLTGVVDPKLSVGEFAPDRPEAMLAVRATFPVNPFTGATVMIDELPEVAPAAMAKDVPLTVKLGSGAALTVTRADPLAKL